MYILAKRNLKVEQMSSKKTQILEKFFWKEVSDLILEPYITVESGAFSDEQKEELIRRLTEVFSEIMKVPQEFF